MKRLVLSCAMLLSLPSPPTIAGIISTTGMVQVWNTPPKTVEVNTLERNLVAIVFEEQTKVLNLDVQVDIAVPGLYETVYPMAPGIVPQGSLVTSYYIHADPRGQISPGVRRYKGSITFDAPIVGILVKPPTLHPTDHLLGLPSVQYPREQDIRHGILERGDYIRLSPDLRTVRFNVGAGLWSDDFRILVDPTPPPDNCHHFPIGEEAIETTPCPAPTTMPLCLLGATALCCFHRRRPSITLHRPPSLGNHPSEVNAGWLRHR